MGNQPMLKGIMLAGIRFYRKYLSPLKRTRCPYTPTCSEYGLEAIEKYGAVKGASDHMENSSLQSVFTRGL